MAGLDAAGLDDGIQQLALGGGVSNGGKGQNGTGKGGDGVVINLVDTDGDDAGKGKGKAEGHKGKGPGTGGDIYFDVAQGALAMQHLIPGGFGKGGKDRPGFGKGLG